MSKVSKQKDGIAKRGDRYAVRVSLPDPSRGVDPETGNFFKKIVRVGTFETMDEAIKARDRARYEAHNGERFAKTSLTVGEFFNRWIVTHSLKVKASTAGRYRMNVDSYIIPRLGEIPIGKLKPLHIGEFYSYLLREGSKTGKPLSTGSVENIKLVLKTGLKYAVNVEKCIPSNPAQFVQTPKVKTKKFVPWTDEQVIQFLDYVKSHKDFKRLYAFFRLSVHTGARSGELLALTWDDFDPIEGRIIIRKSRQRGSKNESLTGTTKTGQVREVYLHASLIEILNTHKASHQEFWQSLIGQGYAKNNLIFATEFGEPLGDKTPYQVLKRVQKRLGLPEQRLHDLRAYAITDLLSEGISPHEVSDRVGAKAETLMKHYASMKPERRILIAKQSGDRLDQKLQK